MTRKIRKLFSGLAAATLVNAAALPVVSTSVLAQSDECVCTMAAPAPGPVGKLSNASGDVFITGVNGVETVPVPLRSAIDINRSSVVSTGADGAAVADIGLSCSVQLNPSMKLSFTASGGNLCVRLLDDSGLADLRQGSSGDAAPYLAGAAIVGSTLVIVGSGLRKPDSLQ